MGEIFDTIYLDEDNVVVVYNENNLIEHYIGYKTPETTCINYKRLINVYTKVLSVGEKITIARYFKGKLMEYETIVK